MSARPKQTILVVDDEPRMVRFVKMNLDLEGYLTLEANDGFQALEKVRAHNPDLVLLDVEMPGMDRFETLKRLREISETAVIMLTVRSDEEDRIKGLDLGADDYVTKPFSVSELMARVKAIFRRVESLERRFPGGDEALTIGPLEIDTSGRQISVDGQPMTLTAREFDLLLHFARHPGRVFSRAQLLDSVWGYGHDGYEHTVNSHINRLRSKIEPDPAHPELIVTVWGVGYKLEQPSRLRAV